MSKYIDKNGTPLKLYLIVVNTNFIFILEKMTTILNFPGTAVNTFYLKSGISV